MDISETIRKRALFPKDLLVENLQANNEIWTQEYLSNKNVDKGYRNKLINFFKYVKFKEKPFNEFVKGDIDGFIEVLIENNYTEHGINPFLSAIREFKEYLTENHPNIFPYNFLKDLKGEAFYSDNQDNETPLSLGTISYVRNYVKKNLNTQYMFELVYQLGIQKQQIEKCLPQYADFKLRAFITKDSNITFKNSPHIEDLVHKAINSENFKVTYNMFSDHMIKLSLHLLTNGIHDKKIVHNTILNTHRAYFISCPNCGQTFENIAENWVLAKMELDHNFRLVCFHCKGASN